MLRLFLRFYFYLGLMFGFESVGNVRFVFDLLCDC